MLNELRFIKLEHLISSLQNKYKNGDKIFHSNNLGRFGFIVETNTLRKYYYIAEEDLKLDLCMIFLWHLESDWKYIESYMHDALNKRDGKNFLDLILIQFKDQSLKTIIDKLLKLKTFE